MGRILVLLAGLLGLSFAGQARPISGQTSPEAVRIEISKADLTLTVYGTDGECNCEGCDCEDCRCNEIVIASYPVALGKNIGNKQRVGDMRTPEGDFTVQQIQNASSWTHDFRDGKGVIRGAYGPWFVRLLTPPHKGIGIHGTHDPASIGTRATEGCIRLRNGDLQEFIKFVRVGLPVTVSPERPAGAGL